MHVICFSAARQKWMKKKKHNKINFTFYIYNKLTILLQFSLHFKYIFFFCGWMHSIILFALYIICFLVYFSNSHFWLFPLYCLHISFFYAPPVSGCLHEYQNNVSIICMKKIEWYNELLEILCKHSSIDKRLRNTVGGHLNEYFLLDDITFQSIGKLEYREKGRHKMLTE